MSIETDIKQKVFKTPYLRLIINLTYTSNWLGNKQLQVVKPYGITLQQYNVLRILRGRYPNPAKISDITERMLDKMSNASRLVDKLVDKELVLRTECPSDRRAVDVVITEKGLALLKALDPKVDELERELHHLSADDATQLSHLLDKLRSSTDNEAEY